MWPLIALIIVVVVVGFIGLYAWESSYRMDDY
jgi:uncharacterized membrane protein